MRDRYKSRKEHLNDKLTRLEKYCDEVGREYDEIEKIVLGTIRLAPDAMTISEVVDLCQEFSEMSFQHVIFNMPNSHDIYRSY